MLKNKNDEEHWKNMIPVSLCPDDPEDPPPDPEEEPIEPPPSV